MTKDASSVDVVVDSSDNGVALLDTGSQEYLLLKEMAVFSPRLSSPSVVNGLSQRGAFVT
jgi:hypothetical protein